MNPSMNQSLIITKIHILWKSALKPPLIKQLRTRNWFQISGVRYFSFNSTIAKCWWLIGGEFVRAATEEGWQDPWSKAQAEVDLIYPWSQVIIATTWPKEIALWTRKTQGTGPGTGFSLEASIKATTTPERKGLLQCEPKWHFRGQWHT